MTDTAVPVVDLARRWSVLGPEVLEATAAVLASGRLLLGPETEAFEQELARGCGRRHAVAVASGTDALRLALVALGIKRGDEVIVPAFTAVPTVAAVCASGAVPVPVDVDGATAALDPAAAAAAITERTRAVVPVHLYGRPAPLPDLGVPVVEDAAQAHGARPTVAPSVASAAAAYSFYPTKNLGGVGDGGAVVTDDEELAARVRLLRAHGDTGGYHHEQVATNSRCSELEAAALRVALRHLGDQNARRRAIAARYRQAAPGLRWHADHPGHVHHLCVLRIAERDRVRPTLPFRTAVHYPLAITEQPAYRGFARLSCPMAEAWAAECLTVPCFPEMTGTEVEIVAAGLAALAPA